MVYNMNRWYEKEQAMKTIEILIVSIVIFAGCDVEVFRNDVTPPSGPRGIYSSTGDDLVELTWLENPEPDVAGYNVFVSSTYYGTYRLIASTPQSHFVDYDAVNGQTYYYAVTAYDYAGNESELSRDVVYDTPRPEGYNVTLQDYYTRPNSAGYDFSTYSIGPYNDQYTDMFFEHYNGIHYMDVWDDTDIQDMGYTNSLYEITSAPQGGWSPTKDVRLIVGHSYVVWTWDNHFAKFRVTSVTASGARFDWAYQLQEGNPRLKPSTVNERRMELGKGAKERGVVRIQRAG